MYRHLRAALVATACFGLTTAPVLAQTTEPVPAPAAEPAAAPAAAPASQTDEDLVAEQPDLPRPPANALAGAPIAVVPTGPRIAYVVHTSPPVLVDQTAGKAAFGVAGAVAAISVGKDIVNDNDVKDPSPAMALAVATAFAKSKGGYVADKPLTNGNVWTVAKATDLAAQADGAQYVVDVESPGMTLIYFPFDWTHYDLMFFTRVRIIETATGKVIAKGKCALKPDKTIAKTHDEMIDNGAVVLKQRILDKSQACIPQLLSSLKL